MASHLSMCIHMCECIRNSRENFFKLMEILNRMCAINGNLINCISDKASLTWLEFMQEQLCYRHEESALFKY